MGVDAFPEDADWAPPPDVMRLLARQTARVDLPCEELASRSASRDSLIGDVINVDEQPEMESLSGCATLPIPFSGSTGPFAGSRSQGLQEFSRPKGQMAHQLSALSAGSKSSLTTAFSRTWKFEKGQDSKINNSPSQDTDFSHTHISDFEDTGFDMTAGSPVSAATVRTPKQRYSIRSTVRGVQQHPEDPFWKKNHDFPWNNSLRPAQDLYEPATPEVCSCLTPFEDGDTFCQRCGVRRPDRVPPPIPTGVPKAISVINQSQDIVDRQYTWSGLYAQRLLLMQVQKYEEDQEWLRNVCGSPRLNPNSLRLAQSKDMLPLFERANEIIDTREQKLEQQRNETEEARLQEVKDVPSILPRSARMNRGLRLLYRWEMKKKQAAKSRMDEQAEAESMQCPFRPEISAASSRITKDYVDVQVHRRLLQDAKRRYTWSAPEYQNSFAPSPVSDSATAGSSPGRSKSAGTPSTAAPSSAGSPASSRGGRSLSPYSRGCKKEPWRGKAAFPKAQIRKPGQAWSDFPRKPRASQACIHFSHEEIKQNSEVRKLDRIKDKLKAARAISSLSPQRSKPDSTSILNLSPNNNVDRRTRSTGRSVSRERPGRPRSPRRRVSDDNAGNGNVINYQPLFHKTLVLAHASYD